MVLDTRKGSKFDVRSFSMLEIKVLEVLLSTIGSIFDGKDKFYSNMGPYYSICIFTIKNRPKAHPYVEEDCTRH